MPEWLQFLFVSMFIFGIATIIVLACEIIADILKLFRILKGNKLGVASRDDSSKGTDAE